VLPSWWSPEAAEGQLLQVQNRVRQFPNKLDSLAKAKKKREKMICPRILAERATPHGKCNFLLREIWELAVGGAPPAGNMITMNNDVDTKNKKCCDSALLKGKGKAASNKMNKSSSSAADTVTSSSLRVRWHRALENLRRSQNLLKHNATAGRSQNLLKKNAAKMKRNDKKDTNTTSADHHLQQQKESECDESVHHIDIDHNQTENSASDEVPASHSVTSKIPTCVSWIRQALLEIP
ncbi:unnamed protein product, partial [Amoebophrya sp. A120]